MVDYLKTYINIKPYNYVSNVTAVLAKDPVDKLLQVNRRTPLIKMEGVMYDENSNPVNYGRQYFRSDKYQFTLVDNNSCEVIVLSLPAFKVEKNYQETVNAEVNIHTAASADVL